MDFDNLSQHEKEILGYLKKDLKKNGRTGTQIASRFSSWADFNLVRSICYTLIGKHLITFDSKRYYYGEEKTNKNDTTNDRVAGLFD
jgi:hypothetical protein